MKRKLLRILSVLIVLGMTKLAAADRPNVVFVLTDDQGYGDLSCHGNPVLKTPYLDRLARESIRFTDFHVAPICTPTRAELMTGRSALANGAYCACSGHSMWRCFGSIDFQEWAFPSEYPEWHPAESP